MTVTDDRVYTHNGRRLGAWDISDGTEQWTHADPQTPVGPPAASEGTLYLSYPTQESESVIQARDATAGTLLWDQRIPGTVQSSPLPAGDHLLLNIENLDGENGNTATVGVRRSTGNREWTQSSGELGSLGTRQLGTAGSEDHAYLNTGSNLSRVSKLDPATGQHMWDWAAETPASKPVVATDRVLVGTYDSISALDTDSGNRLWSVPTFDTNRVPPTVDGETVYAGSTDTGVYAIDATSGSRRWRKQVDSPIAAIAASTDTVYVGHEQTLSVFTAGGTLATRQEFDASIETLRCRGSRLFVGAGTETIGLQVSTQ